MYVVIITSESAPNHEQDMKNICRSSFVEHEPEYYQKVMHDKRKRLKVEIKLQQNWIGIEVAYKILLSNEDLETTVKYFSLYLSLTSHIPALWSNKPQVSTL